MIIQNPKIVPLMQKIKFYLLNINKFRIALISKKIYLPLRYLSTSLLSQTNLGAEDFMIVSEK
jgi:hypothetical protein